MSDPTFTPGPWRVIIDDTGGQFTGWPSVIAPEDRDASVVHRAGFKQEHWGDWSQREACANAHLIAAAPELYAALERALRDSGCDGDLCFHQWHDDARAALARARGDQ